MITKMRYACDHCESAYAVETVNTINMNYASLVCFDTRTHLCNIINLHL